MSEIPTPDWTWINAAADRFERAWKQGLWPRIEDYLDEVELGLRLVMLEESTIVGLQLIDTVQRGVHDPPLTVVGRLSGAGPQNRAIGSTPAMVASTVKGSLEASEEPSHSEGAFESPVLRPFERIVVVVPFEPELGSCRRDLHPHVIFREPL